MGERIVECAQKAAQHIRELEFLVEKRRFLEGQIKGIKKEYERKRVGKKEYGPLLDSYARQSAPELEKLREDILSGIAESKKCLASISLLLEGKQVPLSFNIRVDAPLPFSFSVNIGRPEWGGFWGRVREFVRRLFRKKIIVEETLVKEGRAEKKGWALPIIIRKEVVEKRVEVPVAGKEAAGNVREGGSGVYIAGAASGGEKGVKVELAKNGEKGVRVDVGKLGTGVPIGKGVPMGIETEGPVQYVAEPGKGSLLSRLFQKKKSPVPAAAVSQRALQPVVAAPPQQKPSLQESDGIGLYAEGGGISRRDGFFKRLISKEKKEGLPALKPEGAPPAEVGGVSVVPQKMDVVAHAEEHKPADFSMPPPPKLDETIRLKEVTAPPNIGGDRFKKEAIPLKSEGASAPEVKFRPFKFSVGALVPKVLLPSLKLFSAQPKPLESRPVQKLVPKVHLAREKRSFTAPKKSLMFLTVEAPATYQALANRTVGWMVDRMPSVAQPLFWKIHESGMKVLHRTYVSVALFTGILVGVLSAAFFLVYNPFYVLFSIPLSLLVFGAYYFWPFILASNRRRNMNVNLPFAIHHMAAVSTSGVTPYIMFRILTDFTEYGEVSAEATKIVRHVDVFGQDILLAIKEVSAESPSKKFSEFLNGITSTIETGGDIKEFLQLRAREAIFDYEVERKKYTEALSTYADFFTVILVAAPLFLVAILTIISMLGSSTKIMGFSPDIFMTYATYLLLPAIHLAFLGFLSVSQPEV